MPLVEVPLTAGVVVSPVGEYPTPEVGLDQMDEFPVFELRCPDDVSVGRDTPNRFAGIWIGP